jgi:hypothetical protein
VKLTRTLAVAVALVAAQGCRKPESRERDFTAEREVRYRAFDAQLAVIATQPTIISAMANVFPLTEAGRADVSDKLQKLQMRFDEAKNQVGLVRTALPDHVDDAETKAKDAMGRLDEARKAAWDALDRAPRTDRSS